MAEVWFSAGLRNEQSGNSFSNTHLGVSGSMGFEFVGSLHATRCLGVQSVLLAFSIARPFFFLPHPSDFLVLAVLFLV